MRRAAADHDMRQFNGCCLAEACLTFGAAKSPEGRAARAAGAAPGKATFGALCKLKHEAYKLRRLSYQTLSDVRVVRP